MSEQIALLPDVGPLDNTQGRARRRDPVTSKRAAVAVAFKVGALKHRILRHLADRPAVGANDWELHVHCDPNGRVHSAATRRGELEELGLVTRTAIMRPTDDPASDALVHVITAAGLAVLADLDRKAAA